MPFNIWLLLKKVGFELEVKAQVEEPEFLAHSSVQKAPGAGAHPPRIRDSCEKALWVLNAVVDGKARWRTSIISGE